MELESVDGWNIVGERGSGGHRKNRNRRTGVGGTGVIEAEGLVNESRLVAVCTSVASKGMSRRERRRRKLDSDAATDDVRQLESETVRAGKFEEGSHVIMPSLRLGDTDISGETSGRKNLQAESEEYERFADGDEALLVLAGLKGMGMAGGNQKGKKCFEDSVTNGLGVDGVRAWERRLEGKAVTVGSNDLRHQGQETSVEQEGVGSAGGMHSALAVPFTSTTRRQHQVPVVMEAGSMLTTEWPQPFDYYLVVDFEATCDEVIELKPQEIIEFPSVILNSRTLEIEDCFRVYVRPTVHRTLTEFCRKLTGIQQAQVDAGSLLEDALVAHDRWLRRKGLLARPNQFLVVTWTDWDCKIMLDKECKSKNLNKPRYFNSWVNLKLPYAEIYGPARKGLRSAVEAAELVWEGAEHSGLDDAKNTARLAAALIRKGIVLKATNGLGGRIVQRRNWDGPGRKRGTGGVVYVNNSRVDHQTKGFLAGDSLVNGSSMSRARLRDENGSVRKTSGLPSNKFSGPASSRRRSEDEKAEEEEEEEEEEVPCLKKKVVRGVGAFLTIVIVYYVCLLLLYGRFVSQ